MCVALIGCTVVKMTLTEDSTPSQQTVGFVVNLINVVNTVIKKLFIKAYIISQIY